MNWEAIGALADLIGGAGVILTLVYLAVQVKQNTQSMRENNPITQTDRAIEHARFVSVSEDKMSIFQRAKDT